uniref:Ligand-dependent nuclear receptor corepressor-like protein n=1 Tax=Knipowitschia caucasica TaxID=637954 RepID=A0AAV2JK48_KNICA
MSFRSGARLASFPLPSVHAPTEDREKMASLCKRPQCTIDRRGFRQELDSWRHKLIHCVGFESILDGLFGPELIQDLHLYKDREPHAVSDWSFDENCVFCCLRRNKVKEHLSSLNSEGLEDPLKPLLVKDQTLMIKLERQAEEFLSAVLRKKVVAREILQGMIRQFAAEYTSKSSPQPQETHSDQSLPCAQPASPLSSTHSLNPVLSKLLMIDQDAPLDLTIKKPPAEPTVQDGVLDLSIKKNRPSSCLSPFTPTPKGEPREVQISKFKGLQAVSTLEQFITKLCLHHQRQIINTLSFLQAEPITECFKKRHRGLTPRRNARKSTRGLMYADEIWELKTVRTLAGRGNCPNPLLEFNTSVTPKQNLSRPEGVPPLDMPCAGECREAMDQQIVIQEPTDSELSEMGHAKDTAMGDVDVVVETSQTDQSQVVEETICPSPSEQVDTIDNSIEQASSAGLEQLSENKDVSPQITKEDDLVQPALPETVLDSVESSVVEQSKEHNSSDTIENPLPEKGWRRIHCVLKNFGGTFKRIAALEEEQCPFCTKSH